jgi:cell division protease FtsH
MSKQPAAPPPGDKPAPTAPPPPPSWRHWLWPIALLATLALWLFLPGLGQSSPVTLSYSQFMAKARAHELKDVTIAATTVNPVANGTLTNGHSYTTVLTGTVNPQYADSLAATCRCQVSAGTPSASFSSTLLYLIIILAPFIFVIYFFRRLSRGAAGQLQGVLGVGRSRAKVFDAERPQTKFADVAGYAGPKEEVSEIIDFLRNPGRYQRAGAMAPRGILMIGPPGNGTTLLARAEEGEALSVLCNADSGREGSVGRGNGGEYGQYEYTTGFKI